MDQRKHRIVKAKGMSSGFGLLTDARQTGKMRAASGHILKKFVFGGKGRWISEQTHVTRVFWIVETCMAERRRKELSREGPIL